MAWFKKEETNLDTIPELPDLPDIPEIENMQAMALDVEVKPLPPIPGSNQSISQQVPVRNTIIEPSPDMQKSNFAGGYSNPRNDNVMDYRKIDDMNQEPRYEYTRQPQTQRIQEPPRERIQEQQRKEVIRPSQVVKRNEPVFVRLDNFEATIHGIQEIKGRLTEIEKLISKTKEIKDQEERELDEWEREIQMIRTKMDEIDKNIFDKFN